MLSFSQSGRNFTRLSLALIRTIDNLSKLLSGINAGDARKN